MTSRTKEAYLVAKAKAEAYSATLLCTEPRFHHSVFLHHMDGTMIRYRHAFMKRVNSNYVAVFTEHHGCHVYDDEDLAVFEELRSVPFDELGEL